MIIHAVVSACRTLSLTITTGLKPVLTGVVDPVLLVLWCVFNS